MPIRVGLDALLFLFCRALHRRECGDMSDSFRTFDLFFGCKNSKNNQIWLQLNQKSRDLARYVSTFPNLQSESLEYPHFQCEKQNKECTCNRRALCCYFVVYVKFLTKMSLF